MDEKYDEKKVLELISKAHEEREELNAQIERTYTFLNWVKIYINFILILVTVTLAKTYGVPIASFQIKHSNINRIVALMAIVTAANIVFIVSAIRLALGFKTVKQYFLSFVIIMLNIVTNPVVLHYFYYQNK